MQRVSTTPSWVIRQYLLGRPALAMTTALITIVSAAVEVSFPWLLQQGIDVATGEAASWPLQTIAIAMMVVAAAIVLGYVGTLTGAALLFGHAAYALRQTVFGRLQQMPLATLARLRAGSLAFRATSDVTQLESHLHEFANGLLFHGVVTVAAVVLMAFTSATLTAIVVGTMVIVSWLGTKLGDRLPLYTRAAQMRAAQMAGLLQESIAGASTIRAFGAQALDLQRLDHANRRLQKVDIGAGLLRAAVTPLWHFAESLSIVAVLWYGGSLVMQHKITVGALLGFLAYQQLIADPISRFGQYFYHWQACRALARRIAVTLGDKPLAPAGAEVAPDSSQPLCIQQLTVHDALLGKNRLDGICLQIKPGEKIALLGRNGSGKSTLLNALCALQEISGGDASLGAARLSICRPALWREAFGLMAQDTLLFHGSLAFNLAMAKSDATRAELVAAVAAAGGSHLCARLDETSQPNDLGGQALSGGERRVMAFARLVLRNPTIALLDEPTIHLDGLAHTQALMALRRFSRGRTLMVATHDIEVAKLCDRVVLMDSGRVVADGPAHQLIANHPLCRELLLLPLASAA